MFMKRPEQKHKSLLLPKHQLKLKQGVISLSLSLSVSRSGLIWYGVQFWCCWRGKKETPQPQSSCWMNISRRQFGQSSNLPAHHPGRKHVLLLFGETAAGIPTWLKLSAALSGSLSEAPAFTKGPRSVWQMEVKGVMGAAGCRSPSSCQSERRAAFPCTYMFPFSWWRWTLVTHTSRPVGSALGGKQWRDKAWILAVRFGFRRSHGAVMCWFFLLVASSLQYSPSVLKEEFT